MSFPGGVVKHEQVVLVNKKDRTLIVDGRAMEDGEFQWGGSALFDVDIVRGLPVESAQFNVNFWDVYKGDSEELVAVLLDQLFAYKKREEEA